MIPYCEIGKLEISLFQAVHHKHHRLVSALLDRTEVSPNARLNTPTPGIKGAGDEILLMIAAGALESKSVKLLIEKGAIASRYRKYTYKGSPFCSSGSIYQSFSTYIRAWR